ncbi:hypothetical protein [Microvirga pakistanensis]|uniref:hypothetical protein n=1 Tax=Microvirga pakistanensis TaxID=1682650 RepID=UPI00141AE3A7|nr:hypothetical protein [Microvirga pakistanensis]
MLDRDVLLVRSRGCIPSRTADTRANGCPNRTSNNGTSRTTGYGTCCCAPSFSNGKSWENQGSGNKSTLQVYTHGSTSV